MQLDAISVTPTRLEQMRETARDLEAAFLAEMLKDVGLGGVKGAFGGGAGEDQFASLMREQQAARMVEAGGIGLAEQILRSMMETSHGQHGGPADRPSGQ